MTTDQPAASSREPLVSVLIPTYNSTRFLEEALVSAREQTHGHLEILVVDNCSTDDTREIVQRHAAQDPRIRLEQNERNIGPVGNFRRCLALARGEFVKFLMSDDVLERDCIATLLAPMLDDPDTVLSTSPRVQVDQHGEIRKGTPSTEPLYDHDVVVPGRSMGDRVLMRNLNQIGEPSTVLFRAGVIDPDDAFRYHGAEFRVLADVTVWLTLLEHGKGCWVSRPLSRFRRHSGQDQMQPSLLVKAHWEWVRLVRLACDHGYLQQRRQRMRAVFAFGPRIPLYAPVLPRLLAR